MKQLKKITFLLTLLVIAFTPLDAIQVSEGVTPGRYFFILMALSAIFSDDLIVRKLPTFIKPLLLFSVWSAITILWSIDPGVTTERVMYLVQYTIIVLVMLNVTTSEKRLKYILIAWIAGACFIAFKTATDYQINTSESSELYRVEEFGNPNENSFMLCYALIFCYLVDKTKYHIPSFAMTAYSVYAIIANGSRMGIILFALCVAAFCVSLWQKKQRAYVLCMIPIIILFGIHVFNNIPAATLLRILGITESIEEGEFSHRERIWAAAFVALKDNPLWTVFGSGWGTFSIAVKPYLGMVRGSHNFYLELLFTTGIFGLVIILRYFWILFNTIRKTVDITLINYLLLFVPLISMSTTNWQSRRWWFLMGAFIYLIFKYKNFRPIHHE